MVEVDDEVLEDEVDEVVEDDVGDPAAVVELDGGTDPWVGVGVAVVDCGAVLGGTGLVVVLDAVAVEVVAVDAVDDDERAVDVDEVVNAVVVDVVVGSGSVRRGNVDSVVVGGSMVVVVVEVSSVSRLNCSRSSSVVRSSPASSDDSSAQAATTRASAITRAPHTRVRVSPLSPPLAIVQLRPLFEPRPPRLPRPTTCD